MKDDLGDRLKELEGRTRYMLPRRCYTVIRIDGKDFHNYTKGCNEPFDEDLISDMQETTKLLCMSIQGAKIGYTQSDEISILLTDFDKMKTDAWFNGNLQKIVSVSASLATGFFNRCRIKRCIDKIANFDSRVSLTTADPWEAYNAFLWRQKDCSKNSIQMIARSMVSHKECVGKNWSGLNELIHSKGGNFNDYPIYQKRGSFIYKTDKGWIVDKEAPILSKDKDFFFSKIPFLPQYEEA